MITDTDTLFMNSYTCYRCGQSWQSEDECMPDDDCPFCGARHVAAHDSVELEDEPKEIAQ